MIPCLQNPRGPWGGESFCCRIQSDACSIITSVVTFLMGHDSRFLKSSGSRSPIALAPCCGQCCRTYDETATACRRSGTVVLTA
jgi:hypothetical protein